MQGSHWLQCPQFLLLLCDHKFQCFHIQSRLRSLFTVIPEELCTVIDLISLAMFALSFWSLIVVTVNTAIARTSAAGKISSPVMWPPLPLSSALSWGILKVCHALLAIQSYKIDSPVEAFKLNISGFEGCQSPKTLVANTVIEMSPSDKHGGENSPNVWQHIPFKHEETGMVAEPQILPEEASIYVMV